MAVCHLGVSVPEHMLAHLDGAETPLMLLHFSLLHMASKCQWWQMFTDDPCLINLSNFYIWQIQQSYLKSTVPFWTLHFKHVTSDKCALHKPLKESMAFSRWGLSYSFIKNLCFIESRFPRETTTCFEYVSTRSRLSDRNNSQLVNSQ